VHNRKSIFFFTGLVERTLDIDDILLETTDDAPLSDRACEAVDSGLIIDGGSGMNGGGSTINLVRSGKLAALLYSMVFSFASVKPPALLSWP